MTQRIARTRTSFSARVPGKGLVLFRFVSFFLRVNKAQKRNHVTATSGSRFCQSYSTGATPTRSAVSEFSSEGNLSHRLRVAKRLGPLNNVLLSSSGRRAWGVPRDSGSQTVLRTRRGTDQYLLLGFRLFSRSTVALRCCVFLPFLTPFSRYYPHIYVETRFMGTQFQTGFSSELSYRGFSKCRRNLLSPKNRATEETLLGRRPPAHPGPPPGEGGQRRGSNHRPPGRGAAPTRTRARDRPPTSGTGPGARAHPPEDQGGAAHGPPQGAPDQNFRPPGPGTQGHPRGGNLLPTGP
jgi:hypothetical protein